MASIKIDTETFRVISIFERVTMVQPKDCILSGNSAYFLVEREKMSFAIGKNGSTAKKLSRILAKEIRIFQYSTDASELIKNLIPSAENIEVAGNSAKFSIPAKDRSMAIGRGGKNINIAKEFLERNCGVSQIKFK